MSKINFFFAKISCPKEVQELNFFDLLKKLSEGTLHKHTLYNIPNNLHLAKHGDIIILHIGGDSSNKSRYLKHNVLPKYENYKNGIHAIGLIENVLKSNKEVNIKVIGLKSPVTKNDLYYFPQFINNLGGSTKGTPNQAGLYELDEAIGLSLIDYLNLNDLLPTAVEELTDLNTKNQLYANASKSYKSKFSNKESTNELIKKLPKKSNELIQNESLIHLKSKFIEWINKEDNYKKSYDGLVTTLVLDFWNRAYFDNKLFLINLQNIDESVTNIEELILNTTDDGWTRYSQATSKGAPMAVLGRNNYLKFLNEFRDEIKSKNSEIYKQLSPQIFDVIKFQQSCIDSGLNYKLELIIRYISSLATKPFVLLSGLSGSGKTKLAQAFAQWIAQDNSQHCIVPVGADWTNREPLLGYVNALKDEEYILPENGALRLLIEANKEENKNKPYFLILDEMNLSHVERYFADFLSVMESKDKFKLHSSDNPIVGGNGTEVEKEYDWPANLFVVGTVNIDETTYMFSPKVLDRANVIEFRIDTTEMSKYLEEPKEIKDLSGEGAGMGESFVDIATKKIKSNPKELKNALENFFKELQTVGSEFGYRTASEIQTLFGKIDLISPSYIKENKMNEKIDFAVIQKLLPKLHGSRNKLVPVLTALAILCLKVKIADDEKDKIFDILKKEELKIIYPISLEKIERMYDNVIANGFTSYAEA
jgi:5-methylcytosine-specific restriction protein B